MKVKIINIVKILFYGRRGTSKTFVRYLMKRGMRIGEGTTFYDPRTTKIDLTRPYLITIGNHVDITAGVTILTHGYDWIVLHRKYGNILGSAGKVVIKDNVFIGMNATILKGVTVGSNSIIGANSLVSKDVPDNVVVAGNPARVIMTIDEYYKKRMSLQVDDAKELAEVYYERYNTKPPIEIFTKQFSWIFLKSESNPDPFYDGYTKFLKSIGILK